MSKPIDVTQPDLSSLGDFVPILEWIWDSKILTNGGLFDQQLEDALCEYLGVPYISLLANGTIALVTALRALGVSGEVITTPYSFVATAHALLRYGLTPVFVAIDPETLNLDPAKIEAEIAPQTRAILPVHCYGAPGDVEAIEDIAKKYDLNVIYGAAHAFGVECYCGSILNHGDFSVVSLHATKIFNTLKGGAFVCQDPEIQRYIDQLKNFGFTSETTVEQAGINGKTNEMNTAFGLLQLQHIDAAIERCKGVDTACRKSLGDVSEIGCHNRPQSDRKNYSYFPIFVEHEHPLTRDQLYERLRTAEINGRCYFYPLVAEPPMYREVNRVTSKKLKIAEKVARRMICLPIHSALRKNNNKSVFDCFALVARKF